MQPVTYKRMGQPGNCLFLYRQNHWPDDEHENLFFIHDERDMTKAKADYRLEKKRLGYG